MTMPEQTPQSDHPTQRRATGLPPAPSGRAGMTSSEALRSLFRTVLVRTSILVGGVAVLSCVIGFLWRGLPGLYGALVGSGLAAAFLLTTVVVMLATSTRSQTLVNAGIAGSWLVKVALTLVVIAAIRDLDFYDPLVLVATVAVAVLGTLAVEVATVVGARIPLDVDRDR